MKKVMMLLTIFFMTMFINFSQNTEPQNVIHSFLNTRDKLNCNYFDEKRFKLSLNTELDTRMEEEQIIGGVVPHHLLADKMIADFFRVASVRQPKTVIVVGPNHTGAGVSKVHTGSWNWITPFGILEADEEITSYLVEARIADTSFELMENEHSISAIVPYVKYFMPDAKIIPILVSGTYSLEEAKYLGKLLASLTKEKECLFIASVDFSHYLSLEEANKMDAITKKALEERNIVQISYMDNDYMDSPGSIITLLAAMDEAEVYKQKMLGHSNSALITGNGNDYTTSYFTYVYFK